MVKHHVLADDGIVKENGKSKERKPMANGCVQSIERDFSKENTEI